MVLRRSAGGALAAARRLAGAAAARGEDRRAQPCRLRRAAAGCARPGAAQAAAVLHLGRPVAAVGTGLDVPAERSEEHTSELQSLMRISYAVFCLKKKNKKRSTIETQHK